MNREQPPFADSDADDAPRGTPESNNSRPRVSRAEGLAWCASLFLLASVAWVLLFPSLPIGMRAILSASCLLIGGAFVVAAYRQLS